MAYFIVIGTDNNVQSVVDEIRTSHLQHNVVTSGCIYEEDGALFYQWTVYDQKGIKKSDDNGEKSHLDALLTNQISQFRTLLPDGQTVQIFVISQCLNKEQCDALDYVCDNLYRIGGAKLSNVSVDLVLLGYDPTDAEDVTIRPNWRHIKPVLGIGANSNFNTNILYINNMDYKGGATNVDVKLLARFLCLWSKMVSAGACTAYASRTYSIGLAEYQYNFEDLADFFKLAAEEQILDRTLNEKPSAATEEICKFGYYKDIDLSLPWLDGLMSIKDRWNSYCSTDYKYALPSNNQGHTLKSQKKSLIEYLNAFLKIFIDQCLQKISEKEAEIESLQITLKTEQYNLSQKQNDTSQKIPGECIDEEIDRINKSIMDIESRISACKNEIQRLEDEIERNTFTDSSDIFKNYNPDNILTVGDRNKYKNALQSETNLFAYLHTPEAVEYVRKSINDAAEDTQFPEYLDAIIQSVGLLQPVSSTDVCLPSALTDNPQILEEPLLEKQGCIGGLLKWVKGLFKKIVDTIIDFVPDESPLNNPQDTNPAKLKALHENHINNITSTFRALYEIEDVEKWWNLFNQIIDIKNVRLKECKLLMDGEKDINGNYRNGQEGYLPYNHQKSRTLINMEMVRSYRDNGEYYLEMIRQMKDKWFDSTIALSDRQSLQELIKHQVIDALRGKFNTLKWNNEHPFVNEDLSISEVSEIILHTTNQADFFAEYVKVDRETIANKICTKFYFNDQRMECTPAEFRKKYNVSENSLTPCYLEDFVNSLCAVKVIGINSPVDELMDFKPKREYKYHQQPKHNYYEDATKIVAGAQTSREKIRKIYDWLCENIKYDTTLTIYDADTAWQQKRGVCQAYCELFCVLGESAGLTIDVVCGKSKKSNGEVADTCHSWIYAFTEGYDGIWIDPTWGAGGIDDDGKYNKGNTENREIWFDVDPAWMIYTHYPEHEYWQLQTPQITEEQFALLPFKNPKYITDVSEELAVDLHKINSANK